MRAGERSVNSLTLIISARLPTSLFLSRLKSSRGRKKACPDCSATVYRRVKCAPLIALLPSRARVFNLFQICCFDNLKLKLENWTWSCNSFSLTAWYHLLVFTLISFVSMQSLTLFFSTFPHTEEEQTNVNDEVRIVSVPCALFYNVIPWHILHVLLPQYG